MQNGHRNHDNQDPPPNGGAGSGIPVNDNVEGSGYPSEGGIPQNNENSPARTPSNAPDNGLMSYSLDEEGPRPRKRSLEPWEEVDVTGITKKIQDEEDEWLAEAQCQWDMGPSTWNKQLMEAKAIPCSSVGVRQSKSKPHPPPDIVALERNTAKLKSFDRVCPRPIVVAVKINGHTCRALLDTGSLSDFMSTTLADQ